MNIFQRASGRYVVKFKDKEKWKSRSFKTLAEAEAFQREWEYDQESNKRLTVAESVLVYLKNTQHSCSTEKIYLSILERIPMLSSRFVDTLDRRDLETFRDAMKVKGAGVYTINHRVCEMQACWRWCMGEDLLDAVPWTKYRPLPGAINGHWLGAKDDFMKVLAIAPDYLRWIVETCFAMCLRPGKEVVSLMWKHIDWDAQTAQVFMPKVSREKTVAIPAWWIEKARPRFEARTSEYVCPGRKADHLSPGTITRKWLDFCKKAGVSDCPLYSIRHFAASAMLEAGIDPVAVAAQLGHKNVATTGTYYAHASRQGQVRAAGAMTPLQGADGANKPLEITE